MGLTRGLAAPGSVSDQQAKFTCLFQGLSCSPPFDFALCRGGSVIDPAPAKLVPGAGDPRRNVQGGFTHGWICFTGLLMVLSCGYISSIPPFTPPPNARDPPKILVMALPHPGTPQAGSFPLPGLSSAGNLFSLGQELSLFLVLGGPNPQTHPHLQDPTVPNLRLWHCLSHQGFSPPPHLAGAPSPNHVPGWRRGDGGGVLPWVRPDRGPMDQWKRG